MNSRFTVLFIALGGLLSSCLQTQAAVASSDSMFDEGIKAFRADEFAQASRAFREAAQQQPATGTLLNLGLSEWRRGHAGPAILAWEQALWIDPHDGGARQNLDFAREVMQVESPNLTWYELASTWLMPKAWAWLMGLSLWLVLASITLPRVFRWRKTGWYQAMAAVGLCVFLLSVPANIGIVTRANLGFILEKNTALLLTPTENAESISTIAAGSPARKLRARGNFILIRTQNGLGWVKQEQLGLICSDETVAAAR